MLYIHIHMYMNVLMRISEYDGTLTSTTHVNIGRVLLLPNPFATTILLLCNRTTPQNNYSRD